MDDITIDLATKNAEITLPPTLLQIWQAEYEAASNMRPSVRPKPTWRRSKLVVRQAARGADQAVSFTMIVQMVGYSTGGRGLRALQQFSRAQFAT
eukprot:6176947-Pleurochrysis_carterae.AAC.2